MLFAEWLGGDIIFFSLDLRNFSHLKRDPATVCFLFSAPAVLIFIPPPRLLLQPVCFQNIKANLHSLQRGVMGVWGGVSPGDQWRLTDHINQSSSLWLTLSRSPLCLSVCLHITVSRLQDFNNQAHPSFPHITWELLITEAQRNVLKP